MTGEEILLQRAQESLRAAKIMLTENLPNIAASRAYYAMFYTAELLLQKKGLTFTSHSAVIAAFGKEFASRPGIAFTLHFYALGCGDILDARYHNPPPCSPSLHTFSPWGCSGATAWMPISCLPGQRPARRCSRRYPAGSLWMRVDRPYPAHPTSARPQPVPRPGG
jgi:hypothetical protein